MSFDYQKELEKQALEEAKIREKMKIVTRKRTALWTKYLDDLSKKINELGFDMANKKLILGTFAYIKEKLDTEEITTEMLEGLGKEILKGTSMKEG